VHAERWLAVTGTYARSRAAQLLALLASQDAWEFGVRTLPGFGACIRAVAERALCASRGYGVDGDDWRAGYAAAESRLRA